LTGLLRTRRHDLDLRHARVAEEEAQRLGRILRPTAGANQAHFYTIVSREMVEHDFARRAVSIIGAAGQNRAGPGVPYFAESRRLLQLTEPSLDNGLRHLPDEGPSPIGGFAPDRLVYMYVRN
jgi:hypothetical protein